MLQVRPEKTVTIEGSLDAPLSQIFDILPGATPGIVEQGTSSNIQFVYPQWWGAKGDDSQDDTDALKRAIRFFGKFIKNPPPNPPTVTGKPGRLFLRLHLCQVDGELQMR